MIPQKPSASVFSLLPTFTLAVLLMACLFIQQGHSQTFSVVHKFNGGHDGAVPYGGVVLDAGGNLYGMTWQGGSDNDGALYQIKGAGSGSVAYTLHSFTAGRDGSVPHGGGLFSRGGALYGFTTAGGSLGCSVHGYYGCGVVFSARPPQTVCRAIPCPWNISTLYEFRGSGDGNNPYFGEVAFDPAGNVYGTSMNDGQYGGGTVWKLSHANGTWTETILHNFGNGQDGSTPMHGVIIDSAGNLYGTTYQGGTVGNGTVFELSPSGGSWTETILANIEGTALGGYPEAGLVMDAAGNLYGATSIGGVGDGSVFELSRSGGSWQLTVLYSFPPAYIEGVVGNMVFDSHGNLYGTTESGGADEWGMIFKLSPNGGSWTFTDVHDFFAIDGANPTGDLVIDSTDNIYGTTTGGGLYANCPGGGCGVVWKLTP